MPPEDANLVSRFLRSFDTFEAEIAKAFARWCHSGAADLRHQVEAVEALGLLDETLRAQWAESLAVRSRLLDPESTAAPGREEMTLSLLQMLHLQEMFSARAAKNDRATFRTSQHYPDSNRRLGDTPGACRPGNTTSRRRILRPGVSMKMQHHLPNDSNGNPVFSILGPLVVRTSAGSIPVTAVRQRMVLGILLSRANQVVALDSLAEALWGGGAVEPRNATIYSHVRHLRRTLGPELAPRLGTYSGGYVLHVNPGELDADLFTVRQEAGGRAMNRGDWCAAVRDLDSA